MSSKKKEINISRFVPILKWLPNYKKEFLTGDLSAGVTVGIMLIPQGMAYAMIAGLPPVYGLYAALLPQIIYAIFGTSRQLAVGPVAMDSLLVAAGVSAIAAVGSEQYVTLAILLSFMMGIVQLAFGVFRLGFLVNFLSKPVISGFTSAAALIIGLNQLKYVLGLDLARSNNIFKILLEAVSKFSNINWVTVALGLGGIVLIKGLKKIHKSIPGALVVVVAGILLVHFMGLEDVGVSIVGTIPEGLPSFALPDLGSDKIQELIPVALTLALIAFMEAISVAKAIEAKHQGEYKLDNNQEMIGLGLGNIVGSFFGAYPTTGGFSRSAVNDQAGAKTNLAAVISAVLVGLTLLFLTPLFYNLPKAVLGSIIMVAVFGLIDFKYPKSLFKINKQEFLMFTVAFVVTLALGIKEGIGTGVLISLLALVYRTARPHIAVLGKLPETGEYRNVSRFKKLEQRQDLLILRQDAQLYFANSSFFSETVLEKVNEKKEVVRLVILDFSSVSSVDSSALYVLSQLISQLNQQGIGVYFAGVIGPVRDFFQNTGFTEKVGGGHFFIDIQSAVDYLDHGAKFRDRQMLEVALQNNTFSEGV